MDDGHEPGMLGDGGAGWRRGHPDAEGTYQRLYSTGEALYSFWDGRAWGGGVHIEALAPDQPPSVNQDLPWREYGNP